jgi:HEAT repeat protein
MNEMTYSPNQGGLNERAEDSRATIDSLIADLSDNDGLKRVKARRSLVVIGFQAVKPLEEALSNPNKWVRWEASKALGQIGDSAATQTLIKALEDNMFDVRSLAAEGLIRIGRDAVVPLLHALIERPESIWLREGAHHVLHDIAEGELKKVREPMLAALEDLDAAIEVPIAAHAALDALTSGKSKGASR